MLPKPSILKVPDASSAVSGVLGGCNSGYSGNGQSCNSGFSCNPLNGSTIDAPPDPGCSWTLGIGAIGVGITAIGVGVTIS